MTFESLRYLRICLFSVLAFFEIHTHTLETGLGHVR